MPDPYAVPDSVLEGDICAIGRKGGGKTYAMRGLVERLLTNSRRTIILDPLASWFGLRAKADGTAGFPITVIGGPHGDLPLDPDCGEALGAYLATTAVSCVLDVSELRRPDILRFCADFLRALYHHNRQALWLVLEEADYFCPQGATRDAAPLAYEIDQIARRGRARGFRLWTVTQRPAKLVKDVLSQAAALLLLRTMAPQDRRAIEDWIDGNADPGEARTVVDSLAGLETGEGWVWAPDCQLLERVRFPRIATLDTSYTPQVGQTALTVGALAQADVAALRTAMQAGRAPLNANDRLALDAAKREGYAAGRHDGGREERRRLESILTAALALMQEEAPEDEALEPEPAPTKPATNDQVQRGVLNALPCKQRRILEAVLENHPAPIFYPDASDDVAALLGAGLIEFSRSGKLSATDHLFPNGH